MRKKIVRIMFLLYLMAFPPLIGLYNRSGSICKIPTFIFCLLLISLGMVLSTLILYRSEESEENEERDGSSI